MDGGPPSVGLPHIVFKISRWAGAEEEVEDEKEEEKEKEMTSEQTRKNLYPMVYFNSCSHSLLLLLLLLAS